MVNLKQRTCRSGHELHRSPQGKGKAVKQLLQLGVEATANFAVYPVHTMPGSNLNDIELRHQDFR
jgi:hypothetical protein